MSDTVRTTTRHGKRSASDRDAEETEGNMTSRNPSSLYASTSNESSSIVNLSLRESEECTSNWTHETLDQLMVKSDLTEVYTPSELVERASCDFRFLVKYTDPRMNDRIQKCKNRILTSSPLRHIDVHDLSQLDTDQASALMYESNTLQHMLLNKWNIAQGPPFLDPVEEQFYKRFHVTGEDFSRQLMYMTRCLKKSQQLSDSMYQTLFQHFTGLLGFVSYCQPSLQGEKAIIQGVEVTSVPNLIYPYYGQSKDSMELLAICEVKKYINIESDSVPQTVGNKRQKVQVINHLDSDVMGQHGGGLLLHLPLSYKQNHSGLLGLIVQKTNVTFTYLTCSKKQNDDILSGKVCSSESPPVIQYSRPYNYLKAEDREEILEPFLLLGFLQHTPYKYS